ncbi:disulfide bond formation protein DsbD [Paramagnetospirillum kuznetsovii]|uniref:Disulfide bond formation protein DsbD n=1 Tax=Paramagnetospirillum kuznetsovii TaxID=2053833 RepID=A0A364P1T9_9PROT|nr:protein-disulfide reductase DsbD domain-containing protein [Paramagnetospirillum kuznetsovii]RAU23309.1 disulfide bond formation protein DsbD [Paramagnetospirillum kuznetsovii]
MRLLAFLFSVLLLAGPASAAESSDWSGSESGRVRLISSVAATGSAASLRLGLHFQLAPGWKIYWRSPGDAGYPPRLDWAGSANLGAPVIQWPAPHRFVLAGLQNHGYMGEVVLPLDAPLTVPGQPVAARLAVEFLACAQVCVPQKAELSLDLPAGPAEPSAFAHDIGRFSALVPGDGSRHGLTVEAAEALGAGEASVLRLSLASTEPLTAPDIFVEADEVAGFGEPRVTLSPDKRHAVLNSPVTPGTVLKPLAGALLRITVTDGLRSLDAMVTPVPATASPSTESGLLAMMAVALLGGLILNLMPCVLPVLSIKVLGVLSHGGGERGHVRASFLASAAGIIASFLALAALAIAVKQAGQAVGWGIQFQQPGFLVTMVVLLALFAANLWGVFEISLPTWLMTGGGGNHHTVLGHFLSGAFATLLATPCSAPFLGTAIGFALARGPEEITAIFAALGVGMASPFLAVAAWPDAALRLPKPGRWMITVRKLLGLALAATGIWLLTVLAAQTGLFAALVSGGAVTAAIAIMAVKHRLPASSRSAVGACVVALAGLALAAPFHGDGGQASASGGTIPWVAFDRAALTRLTGEGKVVFVDVTADWCITCKVNKAAVVERGEVARRLGLPQTVAMKADWTKPDETISRYLASFGRYGIPFNAVYGPAAPDGLALSELLSESEVLAALDKAAGP